MKYHRYSGFKKRAATRYVAVKGKAKRSALDFISDLQHGILAYVNSPATLVSLAVVFAIAYTHTDDKLNGAVHELAKDYPHNRVFAFISSYFVKSLGVLSFIPVFMAIPKRSFPVLVIVGVSACIYFMPEANFYQYFGMSILTHLYCHARVQSTRFAVMVSFMLYIFVLHEMLNGAPPVKSLLDDMVAKKIIKRQITV